MRRPIRRIQFSEEFARLARRANIGDVCAIDLSDRMSVVHEHDWRRYAEVDADRLHFYFAPEVLWLPEDHRRGLIAHELGHVLCRDLPGEGTEDDADEAAWRVLGIRISYDRRWPGKGLQTSQARRERRT
jgi:hypothetical protein